MKFILRKKHKKKMAGKKKNQRKIPITTQYLQENMEKSVKSVKK